jgi:hypothetical protein
MIDTTKMTLITGPIADTIDNVDDIDLPHLQTPSSREPSIQRRPFENLSSTLWQTTRALHTGKVSTDSLCMFIQTKRSARQAS